MFRATMCPSSGEITVSVRHLVPIILKQVDSLKLQRQTHQYKNIKTKLYKTNGAIWYNKTCRLKQPPTTSACTCNFKLSTCFTITGTKCHINAVVSPDDGHTVARNVEKRNKHTKENCAPSWLYLQDYTGMHGQQNIKIWIKSVTNRYTDNELGQVAENNRVLNTVTE